MHKPSESRNTSTLRKVPGESISLFLIGVKKSEIDGGGAWEAVKAFTGTVLVGISPAVGVGVGIVAGPIAGVSAGGGCVGAGLSLIGSACH